MASKARLLQDFIRLSENAYNNVYQSFSQIAYFERVNLIPSISRQAFVADTAVGHMNSVEVRGALRIDNLPYKRKEAIGTRRDDTSPHSGGINVLLDSLDIYKFDRNQPSLKNSLLYKSTVRLFYFKLVRKKWKPHLCVRYDFERSYGCHPIFHAQMENGVLDDEVRAKFPELPEVDGSLDLHTKVRLPTANVVGATALLSLAADHLPMVRFPSILREIRKQSLFNVEPWRCDCSSLDDKQAPQSMLASGWYSTNLEEAP